MKKIFIVFLLIIVTSGMSSAQDDYVKFNKDTEIEGKKYLQGEIYQIDSSANDQLPYNIKIGTDIIKVEEDVEKLTSPPKGTTIDKNILVKITDKGKIHIDVSSISDDRINKIKVVSQDQKHFKYIETNIDTDLDTDLDTLETGKKFRLIIPGYITMDYDKNDLKTISKKQNTQKEPSKPDAGSDNHMPHVMWWVWSILVVLFCIIIYLMRSKIFGKSSKRVSDEYEMYKGGSLIKFANKYGGLDKLRLNDENAFIPKEKDYSELPYYKRKLLKVFLYGQNICIKEYSGSGSEESEGEESDQTQSEYIKKTDQYIAKTKSCDEPDVLRVLGQMESRIIREIQKSDSVSFNNNNYINEILREKKELQNRINKVENEKREAEEKLNKSKRNYDDQGKKMSELNESINEVIEEKNKLNKTVLSLDFVKEYAENVFNYLQFCQQVSNDAYKLYGKLNQRNIQQGFAVGHLLMKYQTAVNSVPVGNWLQITEDIKETGATTNRQLIRSFSQLQRDSDREKEFKRLLFSKVLIRYSENILILSEAFKNISRFPGASGLSGEATTFGRYVSDILAKAKMIGLELKHVSLFEQWEKYIGIVEDKGDKRSAAYSEISGLKQGSIAEIVSVGVKTDYDDTKTIIIIV